VRYDYGYPGPGLLVMKMQSCGGRNSQGENSQLLRFSQSVQFKRFWLCAALCVHTINLLFYSLITILILIQVI
jgi:hypothetical protein